MAHRYLIETNRALKAMGATPATAGVTAARELARKLDAAGPDGPSQRLLAQHSAVMRELRIATKDAPKPAPEVASSEPAAESPLKRLRRDLWPEAVFEQRYPGG